MVGVYIYVALRTMDNGPASPRLEYFPTRTKSLARDMKSEHPEGCSENTLALLGFFAAPRKIFDFPYLFANLASFFLFIH